MTTDKMRTYKHKKELFVTYAQGVKYVFINTKSMKISIDKILNNRQLTGIPLSKINIIGYVRELSTDWIKENYPKLLEDFVYIKHFNNFRIVRSVKTDGVVATIKEGVCYLLVEIKK